MATPREADRAPSSSSPADVPTTASLPEESAPSSRATEAELLACVALMRMAEPGERVMGRLVRRYGAVAAADQARRGVLDPEFASAETKRARAAGRMPALDRLAASWAARYADPVRDLAEGREQGARLVVPGDPEWPTQLEDLGDERPYGLWLDGAVNLRFACLRSVAIVGARAATAYGAQVAAELASGLGDRRWTVISGGAYGIDAAAHRGALASGMPTVVVLACGTDVCYPTAHQDLFRVVRSQGVVISEVPMGSRPTRPRFLVRNRLIAALSRGTVVVQAAVRSGALNTAGHASELNRHLMAVPGPITLEVSEGCHDLIRQGRAVCVTSVQEITELVGTIGGDLALERRGPVHPRDALNDETRRVLEAVPSRVGTGPAAIAVSAGVDLTTTLSCLGRLAAAGFIDQSDRGWRLRREQDR
ncbi:DNA-processing protein DprA [Microtetraspora glauca]|uniref:DNA-processing protein DprA n=1 Tax=Microtetraspora glauca TaxID=1996 RepID=A0ABV3GD82_MICGL